MRSKFLPMVLLLVATACGTRAADIVGPPTHPPPGEQPTLTAASKVDATPARTEEGRVDVTARKPSTPARNNDMLEDGRHAAYLTGIEVDNRTLTMDVIQFLTGPQAVDSYHRDNPADPDGPPNDYYIVNENPRLRTLPVAADVRVRLVRLHEGGGAELKPGAWEELPSYLAHYPDELGRLSGNPFWITVVAGRITTIEEQYIP